ncbi:Sterile alpha and TIR motif-containing protein 1, partial [Ophiophagus hannah]
IKKPRRGFGLWAPPSSEPLGSKPNGAGIFGWPPFPKLPSGANSPEVLSTGQGAPLLVWRSQGGVSHRLFPHLELHTWGPLAGQNEANLTCLQLVLFYDVISGSLAAEVHRLIDQLMSSTIFAEIGAIQSLKRIVCYSANGTTSMLAKRALCSMGEEVPRRLLPTVPNWKTPEVQKWLQQIGFVKYCARFLEHQVDGDLLLRLSEEDLLSDLAMSSSITRKRFFRELTELKTYANYSTCDRSNLADWLAGVDPKFRQYTYNLVTCGIDRNFLHRVTEQQLQDDCRIGLGFHRVRILSAARGKGGRRETPAGHPLQLDHGSGYPGLGIEVETHTQLAQILCVCVCPSPFCQDTPGSKGRLGGGQPSSSSSDPQGSPDFQALKPACLFPEPQMLEEGGRGLGGSLNPPCCLLECGAPLEQS